jgi:hypothetical protein
MEGVEPYLKAMEEAGFGKMALPGVEFSFSIRTGDIRQMHNLSPDIKGFVILGLGSQRFFKDGHHGPERNRHFTPRQVYEERENITRIATGFLGKTKEAVLPEIRLLAGQLVQSEGQIPDISSQDIESFYQMIRQGVQIAARDQGFPLIYIAFKEARAEIASGSLPPLLAAFNHFPEYMTLGMLGYAFEAENMVRDKERIQKGEIVCLMPSEKSFLQKMKPLVDHWRTQGWYKDRPLWILFDFLKSNLTEREFEQLVWYVPHPISIDYSPLGSLIVRLFAKEEMTLFPVEILSPDIAEIIDTVEVYNAALPWRANRYSINVADNALLRQKGRGGASDMHNLALAAGGGMIVGADNFTNEAIRKGMKYRRTLPYSGWGILSTTDVPFWTWIPTPNTIFHRLVPSLVYAKVGERIETKALFEAIQEEDIFYQREKIKGWVYLAKDKKSVQVYP